jgi:hypothetical protein
MLKLRSAQDYPYLTFSFLQAVLIDIFLDEILPILTN